MAALGCLVWGISLFTFTELHISAGLLILGGLVHWGMRPVTQVAASEQEVQGSTRHKLAQTFDALKKGTLSELALDFGAQTRAWVEAGVYRPKRAPVGEVKFASTQIYMTPSDYGSTMALTLDEMLAGMERAAGVEYTRRALARSFDQLDWELQEIAEDYLLKYVYRASGLSLELNANRSGLGELLGSVPLFSGLAKAELDALGRQFKVQKFQRGSLVVRAGEAGDGFYVVRVGRAEVLSNDGRRLNILGPGDYFGETSLLMNEKRNASINALTPLEVLRLNKGQFERLLRNNIQFDDKSRLEFHRLGVLRQLPLFAQFEGWELKKLAQKLESYALPTGQQIFKQGDAGQHFYLIEAGKVSVQIDGEERATLGTGEYFGEIALLINTPRSATVITVQPTNLLVLKARDFRELIQNSSATKRSLERTSSRRVLSNERRSRSGLEGETEAAAA
jgi:CRP-like cAMP-binding protein